jgi:hypothetical protein
MDPANRRARLPAGRNERPEFGGGSDFLLGRDTGFALGMGLGDFSYRIIRLDHDEGEV